MVQAIWKKKQREKYIKNNIQIIKNASSIEQQLSYFQDRESRACGQKWLIFRSQMFDEISYLFWRVF